MSDTGHRLPAVESESALLPWLLVALRPMNRTRVKQLLQHGRVTVNGSPISRHDHALHPGDRVAIRNSKSSPPTKVLLPIVHADEAIIVIDKPSGLLTVATENEKQDTTFVRLSEMLAALGAGRPFVVHRLDRETSGLLLFARTAEERDRLQENWDGVEKTYLAVVEGRPRWPEGVVENYLKEGNNLRMSSGGAGNGGKLAITRYRLVATRGANSLLEVVIPTGRKHQIRVHLAGLGCPIIGDLAYGAKTNPARRLGLHAWKLALKHSVTKQRLELESPMPTRLWKK